MATKHIFIVGLPRTGSKLMENILRNCPHIDYQSSGETMYVGHLLTPGIADRIRAFGDLSDDGNVIKLLDYFYTQTPNRGFWKSIRRSQQNLDARIKIDKDEFLHALLKSDRTEKSIYEIILSIHTRNTDRTVFGDKSGYHLYHVDTLLEWFPQAKIIHLIRDPRAILASQLKHERPLPEFLFFKQGNMIYHFLILLHTTFSWLFALKQHRMYLKRYPNNYYGIKFEDLVSQPDVSIPALCDCLDITFDTNMLQPKQVGSSFRSSTANTGMDTQTLTRWRRHLAPWMHSWMTLWTRKQLKALDYAL